MRIAIVVNTRWWRASIDLDGYGEALARLGHSVLLVCHGNDAGRAAFPVLESNPASMREAAFWRGLDIDAAISFNWLRTPQLVRAMQQAGIRVICRADADGQMSARVFPRAAWLASVSPARTPIDRLRRMRHWARRCLSLYRAEDRDLLATVRSADRVAIESAEAATNLARILRYYGEDALMKKVRVVPHSVSDIFSETAPGLDVREPHVFCGGRWNDPQKDAPLLAKTVSRLLDARGDVIFTIAGAGARKEFSQLSQHKRVKLFDEIPRSQLPALLGASRFLLSSSRWESQPIGTLEALCMGTSVVAPALPGFIALADGGRSGTLAPRRRADALARAALDELACWESGERNPGEIARSWRARVSNQAVAEALIRTLD